jgi:hypothetical protein
VLDPSGVDSEVFKVLPLAREGDERVVVAFLLVLKEVEDDVGAVTGVVVVVVVQTP